MEPFDKPEAPRRRGAVVTAVVLGIMVLGIYGVFMFKYYARAAI